MSIEVVEFIKANGLQALLDQYEISARRGVEFPNLVLLKYSQTESPMDVPLVRQCRGIILDEADGWRIVSYPYNKFFNHSEGHAAAIDWSTATAYDKLDGSLMVLYPYRGEWRVASSGTPDAGGRVNDSSQSFADLFWAVWLEKGYVLPSIAHRFCFMFELMTDANRVVVKHHERRLILHGVRDLDTLDEYPPNLLALANLNWEFVGQHSLSTIEQCVTAAAALDPICGEGFVVVDAKFNRVKIKSPRYVALAHLKNTLTARGLLQIIRANESSEFLAYFPELQRAYDIVAERVNCVCVNIDKTYAQISFIPTQKEFAEVAKNIPEYASPLFAIRNGKCKTSRGFLAVCTQAAAERLIGIVELDDRLSRLIPVAEALTP